MLLSRLSERLNKSPQAVKQLIRFLVGGAITVAADYLTFTVLFAAGAKLVVASTLSFLAGFAVSFTINKLWVFGAGKESQHHSTRLQMALYATLFLFNLGFTNVFIYYTSEAGLSAYIGKLCTIGLITAWNFVIYRKIIFRLKEK